MYLVGRLEQLCFSVHPPSRNNLNTNRPASQMRAPLAACREITVDYDTFPKLLYVFGHKTLSSFNPCSIYIYPQCGYFDTSATYPQWFRSQICNMPTLSKAAVAALVYHILYVCWENKTFEMADLHQGSVCCWNSNFMDNWVNGMAAYNLVTLDINSNGVIRKINWSLCSMPKHYN